MSELASWLLEQIAEDEHAARNGRDLSVLLGWVEVETEDGNRAERHFRRWEPARVLAECDAKRRIVDEWRTANEVLAVRLRPSTSS